MLRENICKGSSLASPNRGIIFSTALKVIMFLLEFSKDYKSIPVLMCN